MCIHIYIALSFKSFFEKGKKINRERESSRWRSHSRKKKELIERERESKNEKGEEPALEKRHSFICHFLRSFPLLYFCQKTSIICKTLSLLLGPANRAYLASSPSYDIILTRCLHSASFPQLVKTITPNTSPYKKGEDEAEIRWNLLQASNSNF